MEWVELGRFPSNQSNDSGMTHVLELFTLHTTNATKPHSRGEAEGNGGPTWFLDPLQGAQACWEENHGCS